MQFHLQINTKINLLIKTNTSKRVSVLSECFKINSGGYNSTRVDSVLNTNTVFTSVESIKILYAYTCSVENSSWLTLTTLAGDFLRRNRKYHVLIGLLKSKLL